MREKCRQIQKKPPPLHLLLCLIISKKVYSNHDLVKKFVWVDLGKSFAKMRPCSLKKGGGIGRPVKGHLDGRGVISKSIEINYSSP